MRPAAAPESGKESVCNRRLSVGRPQPRSFESPMTSVLPSMLVVLALVCSPLAIGALVLWRAHRGYLAGDPRQDG